MFSNWLTRIMGEEPPKAQPDLEETHIDDFKLAQDILESQVDEETNGDLESTFHSDHNLEDEEMEDPSDDFQPNVTSLSEPPQNSAVRSGFEKFEKGFEKVEQLRKLCLDISDDLESITKTISAHEINQEIIHVGLNECRNEIQRTKIYARNRNFEMTRDIMDMAYEQSNLVLYDIPMSQWNTFFEFYGRDQKKAVFEYALSFIHGYWKGYEAIDVRAEKLSQKTENGDTTVYWRCLIKMGSPSDAIKLKNRCLRSGYYKIRSGMTKLQRDYCQGIQKWVEKENSKRAPDSETILVRKFQHKVCEVKRSDRSHVKWLEYHAPSAPYFPSRMQQKITLVKAGDSVNSENSSRAANVTPTLPTATPTTPPAGTSATGPPVATGSGIQSSRTLTTRNSSNISRAILNPTPAVQSAIKRRANAPLNRAPPTKKPKNKYGSTTKPKASGASSAKKSAPKPSTSATPGTPLRMSKSDINKLKVGQAKAALSQSQDKVTELKSSNQDLQAKNQELLQKLLDMQAQLDLKEATPSA